MRHAKLDGQLAAQLLRYLIDNQLPEIPPTNLQTKLLNPLKRWFELEGWIVNNISQALLTVGRNNLTISFYPALPNPLSRLFNIHFNNNGQLS